MGSNALLAASAPFTVQDKCVLEAEEACYVLGIESAMPIFAVRGGGEDWLGGSGAASTCFCGDGVGWGEDGQGRAELLPDV